MLSDGRLRTTIHGGVCQGRRLLCGVDRYFWLECLLELFSESVDDRERCWMTSGWQQLTELFSNDTRKM